MACTASRGATANTIAAETKRALHVPTKAEEKDRHFEAAYHTVEISRYHLLFVEVVQTGVGRHNENETQEVAQ